MSMTDDELHRIVKLPRYLKGPEVAHVTSLSLSTIRRLEAQGKFPARRQLTSRAVAWLESEVIAWIESREQG